MMFWLNSQETKTDTPTNTNERLTVTDIDRVIQMAWEDRTPFEAIFFQFGIKEKEVIALMRNHLKRSSFVMWRKRVSGRATKHSAIRNKAVSRFKCSRQRGTGNRIAKR